MSLFISTFLSVVNIISIHSHLQSYWLASSILVWQFELNNIFQDSYMVVSCILRYYQEQIQVLTLIDFGASRYAFIDQNFAYKYSFPLYKFKYSCRLFGFNGQLTWKSNITHIAKAILILKEYFKKLFLFVPSL